MHLYIRPQNFLRVEVPSLFRYHGPDNYNGNRVNSLTEVHLIFINSIQDQTFMLLFMLFVFCFIFYFLFLFSYFRGGGYLSLLFAKIDQPAAADR